MMLATAFVAIAGNANFSTYGSMAQLWERQAKEALVEEFGRSRAAHIVASFRDYFKGERAITYRLGNDVINISKLVPSGPDIAIGLGDADGYELAIAGWHDIVPTLAAAFDLVERTLSGTARVRVDLLRNKPWRYALEVATPEGTWIEKSAVVLLRLSLGRRAATTYYVRNLPAG